MKPFINGLDNLSEAAVFLLKNTKSPVILFDGPIRSGKTTLIKELVKQLLSSQSSIDR